MATQAQSLANHVNAQHSTGPRTGEGKAKSARNATTHGFTTGVFLVAPADRPEFDPIEKALIEDMKPQDALEMDAIREFRDAAMRQLTRYRAAAEMSLLRAINTLRDLQTTRLGRLVHLTKSENEAIGPLASPKVFAFMTIDGMQMNCFAREQFDAYRGITEAG